MNLEYIISGTGMTKIPTKNIWEDPFLVKKVQQAVDQINETPGHSTSALFNAYTEKKFGETYQEAGNFHFKNIHVDSGGLQMITIGGMEITPEDKLNVFKIQAEYGDIGMGFDEIPLLIDRSPVYDNASGRTFMGNKKFVLDEIDSTAIESAVNAKQQVDYFRSVDSKCKVMIIIQGNTPETFAQYGNKLFSMLSEEDLEYVHGIAVADTCIGNGTLESIDMVACVPLLDIPERIKLNVHLLGVGSISRLSGAVLMVGNLLSSDTVLSYDSTSHSSGYVMGKYFTKSGKMISLGNPSNPRPIETREIFADVYDRFPDILGDMISREDYLVEMVKNPSGSERMYSGGFEQVHKLTYPLYALAQVYNFQAIMTQIVSGDHSFLMKKKEYKSMLDLTSCKTYEDYKKQRVLSMKGKNGLKSNKIGQVSTRNEAPLDIFSFSGD